MFEEDKRKKKLPILIIFAVIFILSIGGVYAFFYARAENSGQTITGQTLDINGSTLTISATRVDLNPNPASDTLVPAYFGVSQSEMTTTEVNRALNKKCTNNGNYTGCHVWKITASTTQNIPSANIKLNLSLSNVTDTDEWSYIVYRGTDNSATSILNKGKIDADFPNDSTIDIHSGASLSTSSPAIYYVMIYLNSVSAVQNDGVVNNTTDARGIYNGTVTLEAMGGSVKVDFIPTAAQYITNLYTTATKSIATVNNITYNLAPSVGLMNDRHASMSIGADDGDIRYYGANPNNYVWLGDTYTSDYTIPGTISSMGYPDKQTCLHGGFGESDCTEDITRSNGDKKLWRIVGVFDGKLKLVRNDPIGNYSWDTSNSTINRGYGINQWGPSGNYEGSDLMRLLNPGYEEESINNSLYWNKGTGTVYTNNNSATTSNVSFANTGLSSAEKALIDTATWYTGAYDQNSYVDVQYVAERGSMSGKASCTQGTNDCNDTIIRTASWTGKVGLIYPSDYEYAADLVECSQEGANYSNTGCFDTDWLKLNNSYWTMSPYADSNSAIKAYVVYARGTLGIGIIGASNYMIRPAVYLKSGVTISGGDGSEAHPYELSL